MWFRRKQRNRRLSRQRVLDVQLRSSLVRAMRTRRLALALGVSFGVIFGVYVTWRLTHWALDRLLYENPAFALHEIVVQTDGVIAPDQLRRWAGVNPGANLLALDLAEVKRNLEYVPLIASASVERVLPHTLRLRVSERVPAAQVNLPRPRPGGGLESVAYQLDADGFVLMPLEARQRSTPLFQLEDPLPLIAGVNPHELQAGRRVESPQVRAALQLIAAFQRSPMAGLADLRRIDVGAPEVLVATTGQGSQITFGLQEFERQMRRWAAIHDAGARMHRALASLDLAVSNNIPARWLEGDLVPPPFQKPLRPPRAKKKNV